MLRCSCSSRSISTSASATTSPPPPAGPALSALSPPKPLFASPSTLSPTPLENTSALALLASQPSHYISALLLGRRYLLTPRDILTVPKMKGVVPGDRIELTRILEVGSRDYTLRAMPTMPSKAVKTKPKMTATMASEGQGEGEAAGNTIGERKIGESKGRSFNSTTGTLLLPPTARSIVQASIPRDWQRHPDSLPALLPNIVRAHLVVLEHTKGQMFEVTKFKKRKGYRRTLRSKLGFTKLRMGEIEIGEGKVE